jgi:putative NIF3 family GTP cyclohydrolase 1 type 2
LKIRTTIFCIAAFGLAISARAQQTQTLTARQVIELIQQHVGADWRGQTVDTFKAGNPDTPVTGIATTMMATFDVLKRAAAERANLIITHEPTFYSHTDTTTPFQEANDPVWHEKEAFIQEHNLVVWRFHDHWHLHQPDGILTGMVRALDWQKYQNANTPNVFTIPPVTLRDLAKNIQQKIGIKVLRIVGNPEFKVTAVALSPGAGGEQKHLDMLRRKDVETLVIGEVPEWETIEYVSDAVAEGKPKALILMGHIPSEQAGMQYCAEWLRTFVSGVPITFVPTAEPFWMPKAPNP